MPELQLPLSGHSPLECGRPTLFEPALFPGSPARVAFGTVDRLKWVVRAPHQELRRPGLEQGRQHLLSIAVFRRARERQPFVRWSSRTMLLPPLALPRAPQSRIWQIIVCFMARANELTVTLNGLGRQQCTCGAKVRPERSRSRLGTTPWPVARYSLIC